MIKQPLFGQDSSPHQTSMFLSGIITLIAWIIFCVLSLVVKFKPKTPQYKEVQIVLSSTPVVEKESVEQTANAQATASVEQQSEPVETPVAEAKVEAPEKTAAPAPAKTTTSTAKTTTSTAKTTTTTTTPKQTDPSKKVNFDDYQYANDYSDFDFNNVSSKSNKNNFDWSQFEESSSDNQPAVSQKVDKVTNSSTISGSAASTSTANQRQSSASSSSNSSASSSQAASTSTSNAANAIKNATGAAATASTSSTSSSSSSNQQKFSSDLDITWNGGTVRKQIGSLSISLSPEAGSYIKEKKTTVKVEFTVDEKGYVIAGSVKITPESLLHELVRKEVIAEINKWRFMESTTRSVATFDYTIEKR